MRNARAGMLLALLLTGGAVAPAGASPTTVTISGTMDGTVDGTPFSGVAFTAVATSDGPTLGGGGYTVYPSTLTFDIAGIGTSLPLTGAYAITIGPPQMLTYAAYAVELSASGATVTGFFNAMANVILPSGGMETLFSAPPAEPGVSFEAAGSFVLSLTDGRTVTETGFDSLDPTAAVIPEPNTLAVLGVGLAALGLSRQSLSRESLSRLSLPRPRLSRQSLFNESPSHQPLPHRLRAG